MPDTDGNLRCPCGQILAHLRDDGRWELRHRGRTIVFEGFVVETVCDRCPKFRAAVSRVAG